MKGQGMREKGHWQEHWQELWLEQGAVWPESPESAASPASPGEIRPDIPQKRRVLLLALNMPGYYSLAVRILALMAAQDRGLMVDIRFLEADNSADLPALAQSIAALGPELLGLSVNVWNRTQAEELTRLVRPLLPACLFLWGGQETTNSVVDFLATVPELDYLIDGEGERPFLQLLSAWQEAGGRTVPAPNVVSGLRYRGPDGAGHLTRPADLVASLDEIPSVILAGLVRPERRNLLGVMLEGARGCPNRCSFCFEGGRKCPVRSASISRLAEEAAHMAAQGAGYFHILDPILCNGKPARLRELAKVLHDLRAQHPRTVISVEIYAHQITGELTECLRSCAIIDVGLQSANPATARAIHRAWQPERFAAGLARLRAAEAPFNIYLICGLPEESLATFLQGIAELLAEQPTRIFINELCLLNGTELRRRAREYGYDFDPAPPYRVFASNWMNREELRLAQAAGKAVEKYYNLSFRAALANAPWLPGTAPRFGRRCRIIVPSPCARACPGCQQGRMTASRLPEGLPEICAALEDQDVDLLVGAGVDLAILERLAGQMQLYAPARLRLVAPVHLLADADKARRLIARGFWHFRCSAALDDEEEEADALAAARILGKPCPLNEYAVIRPLGEFVALFPGRPARLDNAALHRYCRHLHKLAQAGASVLTVPDAPLPDTWQERLAAEFPALTSRQVWLRLPEKLLRRALAPLVSAASSSTSSSTTGAEEGAQRLATCLATLGLTSAAPFPFFCASSLASSAPPCFVAGDTPACEESTTKRGLQP